MIFKIAPIIFLKIMEKLLCGDIRYLLSEILDNRDLWNLCKAYPNNEKLNTRLKDLINKKCIAEMMKRMKKMLGNELENFIELLNEVGAAITGSFIIQCLLGENWNTDIDIFVPMRGNVISQTPSDNPTSLVDIFLNDRFKFKDYMAVNRYNNFIDNKIKWVRSFSFPIISDSLTLQHLNKPDFQVILVDIEKDEMENFILQNFDFDIIKNSYLRNKLKILNYADIFSKTTTFKFGNRLGSSIDRCIRYEKKGFKFSGKDISYSTLLDYESFTFRNLKTTDNILPKRYCGENCIIKFTHPNDTHYHVNVKGSHPLDNEIIVVPKYHFSYDIKCDE